MEDSEDEGARSEPEGRAAERERTASFALTRSRHLPEEKIAKAKTGRGA